MDFLTGRTGLNPNPVQVLNSHGDPGIHKGIDFIYKYLNMELFRVVPRQMGIKIFKCVMGALHGAKAGGQEFASDGEEKTGDFIKKFIARKYLNAKGGAAHSWYRGLS